MWTAAPVIILTTYRMCCRYKRQFPTSVTRWHCSKRYSFQRQSWRFFAVRVKYSKAPNSSGPNVVHRDCNFGQRWSFASYHLLASSYVTGETCLVSHKLSIQSCTYGAQVQQILDLAAWHLAEFEDVRFAHNPGSRSLKPRRKTIYLMMANFDLVARKIRGVGQ